MLLGPDVIDPRPDTVSRTATPAYKQGQKLLIMHEGQPHDAVVDEWLGVRRGSKHRVKLGGKEGQVIKGKDKALIEVDLNEANHTKLLFATVNKYESTRQQYCNVVMGKHKSTRIESTLPGKDLPVADQRLYVEPWTPIMEERVVKTEAEGEEGEGEEGMVGEGEGSRPSSPAMARASKSGGGGKDGGEGADGADVGGSGPIVDTEPPISILKLLERMIDPKIARGVVPQPMLFRAGTKAEHDLLHSQILFALARELRDGEAQMGAIRLVPLPVSLGKLAELMTAEKTATLPPRELLIRAFELDYPGHGEMLKQAMEMRALVVIGRVNEDEDVKGFADPMLEELLSNRLIITCAATETGPSFPRALVAEAASGPAITKRLGGVALVLNNVKIGDKEAKAVIRKLRVKGSDSYWHLIQGVHMASCDIGREAMAELQELLLDRKATLQTLDLSYASFDLVPFFGVMDRLGNASLTSLDLRKVPNMAGFYQTIGELLCKPDSNLRLGYLRCDAFEVLEDEPVLSLRETRMCEEAHPGGLKLLAGLLTHNTTIKELDLTASNIGKDGAAVLAEALGVNKGLTSLKMAFNPEVDEAAKAALRAAAEKRSPPLALEL